MPEDTRGRAAPTNQTVAGDDWYGRTFAGERHERVLFADIDATEASLTGVVFTECTFRRVQFNCSVHRDGAFINCTFANCSFFETKFTECKLMGSVFDRCTFDLMHVVGGNWAHVGMARADLRKARFHDVRLREADLTGTRCQGGELRDCDLGGAWLSGAVLSECDVRGSDLTGIEPDTVELRGAIITVEQAVTIAEAMGLDVRAS